jgi:hypothetical protein
MSDTCGLLCRQHGAVRAFPTCMPQTRWYSQGLKAGLGEITCLEPAGRNSSGFSECPPAAWPQWLVWASHILTPKRKMTATRIASLQRRSNTAGRSWKNQLPIIMHCTRSSRPVAYYCDMHWCTKSKCETHQFQPKVYPKCTVSKLKKQRAAI